MKRRSEADELEATRRQAKLELLVEIARLWVGLGHGFHSTICDQVLQLLRAGARMPLDVPAGFIEAVRAGVPPPERRSLGLPA